MDKDLELAIDIFYINTQTYLTTIYRSLTFKATVPIATREHDDICEVLDVVFRHYNDDGYNIVQIHADKEFKSLLDRCHEDLDFKFKIANPNEHLGDAERLNTTLQEKLRTHYYRLPFKVIPRLMVYYLAIVTI